MNATNEMSDSVYAKLLAKSLPRPIRTEGEHQRLIQRLLELDERDDPSPKKKPLRKY